MHDTQEERNMCVQKGSHYYNTINIVIVIVTLYQFYPLNFTHRIKICQYSLNENEEANPRTKQLLSCHAIQMQKT